MDRAALERMEAIEDHHWWFEGRRSILKSLIEPLVDAQTAIMEAGCGSGGNLALLKSFGTVDAFEYDDFARRAAIAKSGLDIPYGALPDEIPYKGKHYDLIVLLDVLEHIEDDRSALMALSCHLKAEGHLLITVPAFPWMWSKHDEHHHHFRRYTRESLTQVAELAGLKVVESHYFNTLLFPLAFVARGLKTLLRRDTPDDQLPAPPINSALTWVFKLESRFIRQVSMPLGLSLAAVLVKA